MVLLAAALSVRAAEAGPLTFTFSQTGYSNGSAVTGSVTGSFTGTDINHNGALSSFDGEISAYSMTFSSSQCIPPLTCVPTFTHLLADFGFGPPDGLIYVLGTLFLGDDQTHGGEGIASGPLLNGPFPPPPSLSYSYKTGYGPTGVTTGSGIVQDNNFPNLNLLNLAPIDMTANYVVVHRVPEPGTLAMLSLGLAGAVRRLRLFSPSQTFLTATADKPTRR